MVAWLELKICFIFSGWIIFLISAQSITCANGTCDSQCPDSRYGESCSKWCPSNCIRCQEKDTHANSVKFPKVEVECTECRDGHFSEVDIPKCQSLCPSECQKCTSPSNCTSCHTGYYLLGKAACIEQDHYGTDCNPCSKGCSTQCDVVSGKCSCKTGYTGELCDTCANYKYGANCMSSCTYGCLTCVSKSSCTSCYGGYYLQEDSCLKCKDNCSDCSSINVCLKCQKGYYGVDCNYKCSDGCLNGECDTSSGKCNCTYGFEGPTCNKCNKAGYCNSYCPHECVTCDQGVYCRSCLNGYFLQGTSCEKCRTNCTQCSSYNKCSQCIKGYYGADCSNKCSDGCSNGECDTDSGTCSCKYGFEGDTCNRCTKAGYCNTYCPRECVTCDQGVHCKSCTIGYFLAGTSCERCRTNCSQCSSYDKCSQCINGHYGADCSKECSAGCSNVCNSASGICDCKRGFKGEMCDQCVESYYCTMYLYCPANCLTCNRGKHCTDCKNGFYLESDGRCSKCINNCYQCSSYFTCMKCQTGFYGEDCSKLCVRGCLNGKCDKTSGSCTCKSTRFTGDACDICREGLYGDDCNYSCQSPCKTCSSRYSCTACIEGFYINGTTCEKCKRGCKKCSSFDDCSTCGPGFTGENCGSCLPGKHGTFCNIDCPQKCLDNICNKGNGHCSSCVTNFKGPKCDSCVLGLYGTSCDKACPPNCKDNSCSPLNGRCSNGCDDNFAGITCADCVRGKYGPNCSHICPDNCWWNKCNGNGTCMKCKGRFTGDKCDQCIDGYFGINCNKKCQNKCRDNTCSRNNGTCTSCKDGLYGGICSLQCPESCVFGNCSQISGTCTDGCKSGYSGDKCCIKGMFCKTCSTPTECAECEAGKYNANCSEDCPVNCANGVCNNDNGTCGVCANGFTGSFCEVYMEDPGGGGVSHQTVVIGAGGAGLFVIVLVAFVGVCLVVKRRSPSGHKAGASATDTSMINNEPVNENEHTVSSMVSASSNSATNQRLVKIPMIPVQEASTKTTSRENAPLDESVALDIEENVYYNDVSSLQKGVAVSDLSAYIEKKGAEFFNSEFKNLPKGLIRPHLEALKEENASKNRYNGIYPYDETRVKLRGTASDYINACYIDGAKKPAEYIAALGPIAKATDGFKTFWRMVWQEKSEKIVMVTNLVEIGGMKCEQYWPDVNKTEQYDDVTVTCHSQDIYAEYTVRSFTVKKEKEQRTLYHIHFTAWPDKGVPEDVTSLIEFRNKVNSTKVKLGGPVIVHCSAGIGRTGTYIALDILTNTGKRTGYVDIFDCVKKLRHQRTGLVQTAEQYSYLHRALVHTLTLGSEAIQADTFRSHMSTTSDKQMKTQFEKLSQCKEKLRDEERAALVANKTLKGVNRNGADIAGDMNRPRLYHGRSSEDSDYINAVFVNSFKLKNQFIMTQTPLPTTVNDFLTLVVQENCSCIVSMDPPVVTDKSIGVYLPADNQVLRVDSFEVQSTKVDSNSSYTLRELTITSIADGQTTRTVQHFQYTNWPQTSKVPANTEGFLQFVNEVQKTAESSSSSTVVVHCRTGSELSGLLCVVVSLLQKIEIEHEVSVINTVRQVKVRRPKAIPNKEQFVFCHECVAAYLQTFDIYSNFS